MTKTVLYIKITISCKKSAGRDLKTGGVNKYPSPGKNEEWNVVRRCTDGDPGEKMKTAFIVLDIMFAIGMLLALLTALPKIVNYLKGCFGGRQKPLPKAQKKHRFAIIIPARNESAVIGKLLDSLDAQTFGPDHGDVFIAVERADDPTCRIAGDFGAEVYFKKNFDKTGKGYVLEEVVDHIFKNRADRNYEAFMIIDADNILEPDYIEKLNDALDAGFDIAVGYRNSKNWNDGWIAADTGLTFTRFSRFSNFGKASKGHTVLLTGTCYYVKTDIVRAHGGWKWHSLTEDVELTTVAAINGYKTTYVESAVFYDEQPTSLKASVAQRKRWVKGFFNNSNKYGESLYAGIKKGSKSDRASCLEAALGAAPMMLFAIFFAFYTIGNAYLAIKYFNTPVAFGALYRILAAWGAYFMGLYADTATILFVERKNINMSFPRKVEAVLMRPLYSMLYLPIALSALTHRVEWVPIEHKVNTVGGKEDKK